MSKSSITRIKKELLSYNSQAQSKIKIEMIDNNVNHLMGEFDGPTDTPVFIY
jgi:hypothetical protein